MRRFSEPINVTDPAFSRAVEQSPLPVVLVFHRANCEPCTRLDTALKEVARDFAGRVLVARADVADAPEAARRYRITAVPTIIFVRDGREVERTVGEVPAAALRQKVEELLGTRPRTAPLSGGAAVPLEGARTVERPPSRPRPNGAAQRAVDRPITVTDATFQQLVTQSQVPVVVDFWAPWCAPCRMIAPALEDIAREFAGRLVVAKLNVDENPNTAAAFGIMSIPTLIVFRNGQPVDRIVGALPPPLLRQRIVRAAGLT